MVEGKDDLQLIKEFQAGNQASFEMLIGRYSEKAYSLASRYTGNAEDAEEVLQDVFVTVHKKIGGFEGKSSFSSWLYRVTVNAALMKIRKRKQDRSMSIEDVIPQVKNALDVKQSDPREGEKLAYRRELMSALEAAIQGLPEEYRPVFILRDIDGLTSREVGKILNLTVPAVKSRLHRSRLMLRRRLAEFYDGYAEAFEDDIPKVGNL